MALKRKYVSEDDSCRGPPPKRSRRQQVEPRPQHTRSQRKLMTSRRSSPELRRSARTATITSKGSKKSHRPRADSLATELANLADHNAPPKPRGARCKDVAEDLEKDEDAVVHPSSRRVRPQQTVQHGCITKAKRTPQKSSTKVKRTPQKPSMSPKHRTKQDRLRAEVALLSPWPHWDSDPEDSSTESDDEQDAMPRHHSRSYPSKQIGVQNAPWSEIPAELRNNIYKCCMEIEEKKTLNVVHYRYPDGIPRRSVRGIPTTTNFARSFWGFTQTCKQVRDELTPWLLTKRRVRTPLTTLDSYVELFHRRGMVDGKRIGRIEPICTGAALPSESVEFLSLVKDIHSSSDFHLELSPRPLYPIIDDAQAGLEAEQHDNLAIVRGVSQLFASGKQSIIDEAGITAIRLSSVARKAQENADSGDEDEDKQEDSHETVVILDIRSTAESGRDEKLRLINRFLFASGWALEPGLKIQAKVARGNVTWRVRDDGNVQMRWKPRQRGVAAVWWVLSEERDGETGNGGDA
jgi:hypothetical protein